MCIPDGFFTNILKADPSFNDSSATHPNGEAYQSILENNQKLGAIGISVMIKDDNGTWLGTAGKADIANNIDLDPTHPMFIASITKVFSAALVYTLIEHNKLTMDDYVRDWISEEITKGVANADLAQIRHLLSHTSGIPDYYDVSYDMARMNAYHNGFSHEETLEYAKSKESYNEVGEGCRYSNTNFLLLGMIMEAATGTKLSDLFSQQIFQPLQFTTTVWRLCSRNKS